MLYLQAADIGIADAAIREGAQFRFRGRPFTVDRLFPGGDRRGAIASCRSTLDRGRFCLLVATSDAIALCCEVESASAPAAPTRAAAIEPGVAERCQRVLAEYIGPIAPVVCERILAENPTLSLSEIAERLAANIADADDAREFKRRFQQDLEGQ